MRIPPSLGPCAVMLLLLGCVGAPEQEAAITFDKPLSFSVLEDYDKGDDLNEVEADFLLFNELGITTWRGSFGWDDYEPQPGDYDFAWLHQFAELAARHRIMLRPYLGYTPAWAARPGGQDDAVWNNPPEDTNDWRRFVFRLASAMKRHPNVLSYEMYNEQNSPLWWDGSVDDYVDVLQAGSDAVRAAKGDDEVLPGGLTYPDVEWVSATCEGLDDDDAIDVVALHAYPETWPGDMSVEDYLEQQSPNSFHEAFLPQVDRGCGRKAIWINETGFATTPGKRTEVDQAHWWVRAIATFAADKRVEHIGIYEIKDRRRTADVIGEPENYYLGLTYPDRRKKLAFHTVKRLVRLLNTGHITVADRAASLEVMSGEAGRLFHHVFILPDGRQIVALWSKDESPVVRLRLPRPGSRATEYALDGSGTPSAEFKGVELNGVRLSAGRPRVFEIAP